MGCSWATAFFHIILQKSQFWLMYNWTWLLPVLKVMLRVISNHLFLLNNIIVFTKKTRKNILAAFIQFNLCLSSNVISWVHSCRLHCKISVDLFIFSCDFLLIRERGHFKRFFILYSVTWYHRSNICTITRLQLYNYNHRLWYGIVKYESPFLKDVLYLLCLKLA